MSKISGLLSTGALLLHGDKRLSGLDFLSRVDGEDGTWYYWLSAVPGVYELKLRQAAQAADDTEKSKLVIRYYPAVEESVFENFACREQILRLGGLFDDSEILIPEHPDVCPCCGGAYDAEHEHRHCHAEKVKRAKGIPKLTLRKRLAPELFAVGSMECVIKKEALQSFKITTQDFYKEYADAGIQATDADGKPVELIAPQGLDRNVPGYALTENFLDFFTQKFLKALSIASHQKERVEMAGDIKHILGDNQLHTEKSREVKLIILSYEC